MDIVVPVAVQKATLRMNNKLDCSTVYEPVQGINCGNGGILWQIYGYSWRQWLLYLLYM